MKSSFSVFVIMTMLFFTLTIQNAVFADVYDDTISVFKTFDAVKPFFKNAYAFAVFPNVGKGGMGVGGAYGKGKVYVKDKVVGETSLLKGTIGLQIGGQVFSEVIFFQDKRAFDEFTSGTFELDAAASAVALMAGAQAKAGTEGSSAGLSTGVISGEQAETNYWKGTAVFIHTKGGLMAEAAIGGQKFNYKPLR